MIYTTYFAMLRHLPENVMPVSICGRAPDWYKGAQYKKLAPKYDFFKVWKETHDNEYYIRCFNEQVLSQLDPNAVESELMTMLARKYGKAAGNSVALVCYEKPGDFCHRHLVADWLSRNGALCKEWEME